MPGTKAGATKSTWTAHLKECAEEWKELKGAKSGHRDTKQSQTEAKAKPKTLKGKAARAVKAEVAKARKVAAKSTTAANAGHAEAQRYKRQKTAGEKEAFRKKVAASRKPSDTDATTRALTRTLQDARDKRQLATERAIEGARRVRITSTR